MSTEWIITDCSFQQIVSLVNIRTEVLTEFIDNVLYKLPHATILLKDFSNIYVLVAHLGSESLVQKGEKKWEDILNEDQYTFLKKNHKMIIAYMLLDDDNRIEWIDTVVRKNNLAKRMMEIYYIKNGYRLKPKEIIPSAEGYWKKYNI